MKKATPLLAVTLALVALGASADEGKKRQTNFGRDISAMAKGEKDHPFGRRVAELAQQINGQESEVCERDKGRGERYEWPALFKTTCVDTTNGNH